MTISNCIENFESVGHNMPKLCIYFVWNTCIINYSGTLNVNTFVPGNEMYAQPGSFSQFLDGDGNL